ncbi:MAG TPA: hypothetical protein ENJ80_15115 [Gammaproteobacteria bacterium]|nr:hypothetical protein [Gammaproteobacteria bacterium]
MNISEIITLWSENRGLSLLIWTVLLVTAMYLARTSAHQSIAAAMRSLRAVMRMTATSLLALEQRMTKRNKQVILQAGQESTELAIEREFQRVNVIVERDLSGYPAAQRTMTDLIERIESDYQASNETPPSPPEWLAAVDTISRIDKGNDSTVGQVLQSIQETIETSHEETIKAYRKSSLERLQVLKKMLPSWRGLSKTVTSVSTAVTDLGERSQLIDKLMDKYERIRRKDDQVARMLASSSLTQFFIAGLVLVIAMLGGVINYQLIALPMSEMVGGVSEIGGWRTADIAAMVIILVEVAMGLFLLESLRITHLFPIVSSMDDRMRGRMVVVTLTILTILAGIEASLAYMRDLLALDREALAQSLSGVTATNVEFRWIPSIGQMIMGFVLPFALAFVAIPLESFIHASRTTIGLVSTSVVRMLAYVARIAGQLLYQAGRIMIHLYDMVIFLPLSVEQYLHRQKAAGDVDDSEDAIISSEDTVGGIKP